MKIELQGSLRSCTTSRLIGLIGFLAGVAGCSAPMSEETEKVGAGEDALLTAPGLIFNGITSFASPPDTIGEVGPSHYVQAVNATDFQVWNKMGGVVSGPTSLGSLWPSGRCSSDFTDPTVNYDQLADRWILSQIAPTLDAVCLAVSRTPVPGNTGADYFLYEIVTPNLPDYQKIGVWPDAYYMTTYEDPDLGLYALDRAALLAGTAPSVITCAASGSQCLRDDIPALGSVVPFVRDTRVLPVDLEGATPPAAGTPGLFVRTVDDQQDPDDPTDRIEIFSASVDWMTQTWTVTGPTLLLPDPFDTMLCNRNGFSFRDCIPQPGAATDTLDALSNRPMMPLRYRQFAGYGSLVFGQTVEVADLFPGTATAEVAGIRWYELRNTAGTWSIFDQGDYSPQNSPSDNGELIHRWMGSLAQDGSGNLALGYSLVNSDNDPGEELFPAIAYTGRLTTDPAGTMRAETLVAESTSSLSGPGNRWGDYSAMSVDPTDDCTFWYTTHLTDGSTRIFNFRFDECTGSTLVPACVLGESNVDIRDRSSATAEVAAGSFLELGAPGTITGNARSGGNARLRNNARINGDLTLGGTLITLGAFTITGTLAQNASPQIPSLPTKTFPVGAGSQTIPPNAVVTLLPGNRGNVTIGANADVTLTTGTYNFASLNVQPDADLIINGTVELNVQGNFEFGDRADVRGTGNLTVYTNGTVVRIGTDATFTGLVISPNANVTVSSRTRIDGCVGGENVTFEPDVTLVSGGRSLPVGPALPGPTPPPSGVISATLNITSSWSTGYCADIRVTNSATVPTTTWNVGLNMNGTTIYTSWNGGFSANSGNVTVTPSFSWNRVIAPGATNDSVGFCANRPPGGATAIVTSATGTF